MFHVSRPLNGTRAREMGTRETWKKRPKPASFVFSLGVIVVI